MPRAYINSNFYYILFPSHIHSSALLSECGKPLCMCVCSHLQVPDELSHGDLLGHSVVEAVAVEDHALQDRQRTLKDGHIHHWLVHITRNLSWRKRRCLTQRMSKVRL